MKCQNQTYFKVNLALFMTATLIHLKYYCAYVLCSIFRLRIPAFAYFFTSKVHCGSAVRFGQALLAYLITAHHL